MQARGKSGLQLEPELGGKTTKRNIELNHKLQKNVLNDNLNTTYEHSKLMSTGGKQNGSAALDLARIGGEYCRAILAKLTPKGRQKIEKSLKALRLALQKWRKK